MIKVMVNMTTMKKTGSWLQRNGFNLIVSGLLSIIAFGGMEVYTFFKEHMKAQIRINEKQQELNMQMIQNSAKYDEQCRSTFEIINSVNETNMRQGVKIMENTERSIRNEVDIKHLKTIKP